MSAPVQVTMHGLAVNVTPDLTAFSRIVPCGIDEEGRGVTSLQKLLAEPSRASPMATTPSVDEVRPVVLSAFSEVFGFSNLDVRGDAEFPSALKAGGLDESAQTLRLVRG